MRELLSSGHQNVVQPASARASLMVCVYLAQTKTPIEDHETAPYSVAIVEDKNSAQKLTMSIGLSIHINAMHWVYRRHIESNMTVTVNDCFGHAQSRT